MSSIPRMTAYELASKMAAPLLPPTFDVTTIPPRRWCDVARRMEPVRYVHEDHIGGRRVVMIGCTHGTGHVQSHLIGVIRDE